MEFLDSYGILDSLCGGLWRFCDFSEYFGFCGNFVIWEIFWDFWGFLGYSWIIVILEVSLEFSGDFRNFGSCLDMWDSSGIFRILRLFDLQKGVCNFC